MSAAHHARHVRPGPRRPAPVRRARRGGDLGAQVHLPLVARRARQAGRDGRRRAPRETEAPAELSSDAVTVLDIYGSLFFAAAPKIRESPAGRRRRALPRGRAAPARPRDAAQRHDRGDPRVRGRVRGPRGPAVPRRRRPRDGGPAPAHRRAGRCWGPTRWWRRRTSCTAPARRPSSAGGRGWRRTRTAGRRPPGGLSRRLRPPLSRAGRRRVSLVAGEPALRVLAAPVVQVRDRELARRAAAGTCGTRPSRWACGSPPARRRLGDQRYSTRSGNRDHQGQVAHVGPSMEHPSARRAAAPARAFVGTGRRAAVRRASRRERTPRRRPAPSGRRELSPA